MTHHGLARRRGGAVDRVRVASEHGHARALSHAGPELRQLPGRRLLAERTPRLSAGAASATRGPERVDGAAAEGVGSARASHRVARLQPEKLGQQLACLQRPPKELSGGGRRAERRGGERALGRSKGCVLSAWGRDECAAAKDLREACSPAECNTRELKTAETPGVLLLRTLRACAASPSASAARARSARQSGSSPPRPSCPSESISVRRANAPAASPDSSRSLASSSASRPPSLSSVESPEDVDDSIQAAAACSSPPRRAASSAFV